VWDPTFTISRGHGMTLTPSTRRDPLAHRVVELVLRRWKPMTAVLLACVAGLLYLGRGIRVDNALKIWFIDGDPVLAEWDEFKRQFGNDELVIIGVTDPTSVYSPAALERIRAASRRLEQHPKVRRVTSLGVSRSIDGDAVEIRTEPLLDDGPVTEQTAAAVRRRVEANPIFHGTITAANPRITLIVIELATLADLDAERPTLLAELRAIATAELDRDGGTHHFSGMGVVYEGLNAASLRDSAVFLSLSYLVVFLGLWLLFRRLVWVLVGAAIVTVAILATLGICGATGRNLNMVTAVIPTFLITVGLLDYIHLVDSYEEHQRGRPHTRRVLVQSLAVVIVPCAFNTLTDVVGFISLPSAPMSAIQDFGWLASIGLGLMLVICVLFTVPALARFGGHGLPAATRAARQTSGALLAATMALFELARRRRGAVLAGGAALFAASIAGIVMLRVDTYTIGFLDEEDPVRRDHDLIEREFGPFVPYEFLVETPAADGVKEPALLRRIDQVERAFEAHPRVSRATGLPEILRRINQVVMDGDPAADAIPDTRPAVAQELLLYENDERNDLDTLVDGEFTVTRVTARSGMPSVGTVGRTIAELERAAAPLLGDGARLRSVGYMAVYVRVIENIAVTQIVTFAIALGLITIALMVFLRSVRLGLIALVPNLLPVAMTLGFMGFAGIDLDVATVLIAAIIIGITVNDTSHIMFRFRHELGASPDDGEGALRRTMQAVGRPVVASSLILAAGFAVLLFAGVKSIFFFGLLCLLATMFALVADLLITPAVLLAFPLPPARRGGSRT
jgi:predicted RND superfamily exporter protein